MLKGNKHRDLPSYKTYMKGSENALLNSKCIEMYSLIKNSLLNLLNVLFN